MYVIFGEIYDGSRQRLRIYVNFEHPFEKRQPLSELAITQHANLVYDFNTLEIIKNRYNVELTDDLLQQINDVLLIQEL